MPLREWAKKHINKKEPKELAEEKNDSPQVQIVRSDTMGVARLQIPETGTSHERGNLYGPSPILTPSPKSPKPNRLSRLGARHRSTSQNSLPDWIPPDESDPNAERDWEARATKLAKLRPTSMTASQEGLADLVKLSIKDEGKPVVSSDGHLLPDSHETGWAPANIVDGLTSDEALQEAIRLHEAGGIKHAICHLTVELAKATVLFKKIAEQPVNNDNRVLGQLLYGLALRYNLLESN